ncbi:MFS transporter [Paenibacillus sp. UMB4589-SE434]|uniref:MFS transporter n=1 Tax=Paenibacillus sp. UMB4589-SE434 TaxID=3046314 RepID=UPI002549F270|nr:MFS transporter [Paenibacillus sp. UMB4589-SE434]MDK8183859.1 MFS transporter [Paenibacillus sp. UMB4589-SE434]
MRSVVWLYLFLFIAFFDLHAQYPILTPFAVSLGAAPSFIGLMMGMYSFTHLPGNLLAGFSVDRFGSRIFIVLSLLGAGILLVLQAHVVNPWQLLVVRSISGFVLAFLSPACLALLARFATNQVQQGKLMAGNGLVHTLASVVSPAAGAYLVAQLGFTASFQALGIGLFIIGLLAIFMVRVPAEAISASPPSASYPAAAAGQKASSPIHSNSGEKTASKPAMAANTASVPWSFYIMPFAISCSQGILFFELPFVGNQLQSIMHSGILFSAVSLGALCTLSMLFLNHYPAYARTWIGTFVLSLLFFVIAIHWPVPLFVSLFLIGMTKGVILPAMSAHLLQLSGGVKYGRIFSYLSIAFSIGSFLGPLLAGQFRNVVSPFFIAFLVLMAAVTIMPARQPFQPFTASTPSIPESKAS